MFLSQTDRLELNHPFPENRSNRRSLDVLSNEELASWTPLRKKFFYKKKTRKYMDRELMERTG